MIHRQTIRFAAILLVLLLMVGCATLPKDFERHESFAYTDVENTRIDQAFDRDRAKETGLNGFVLLGNGLDAFVARAMLAKAAKHSIDAQYYLLHNDLTGYLFIDQLVQAADRGVRVRLLVDDMDLANRDLGAAVLDSHPHMEVRIFNPFSRNTARTSQFLTRFGSVTRRMHNKAFIVDNKATILGGRNIGDEYFDADPELAFADLDVLVVGDIAEEVSFAFDLYWNSELAYPATVLKGRPAAPQEIANSRRRLDEFVAAQADSAYLKALKNSKLANQMRSNRPPLYWGSAEVIYDEPQKITQGRDARNYHLGPQLGQYFNATEKELIILSPYFVPGKRGTAFLASLADRGVKVRILTNSLSSTDVSIVHAGYAKYRKRLLRAGVEIYELNKKLTIGKEQRKKSSGGFSKASLHSKSFIFDRKQVFIGSLNLDPRSIRENTEIGLVLESSEIAEGMAKRFSEYIDQVAFRLELVQTAGGYEKIRWHGLVNGEPRIFDKDPYTGFWQRFNIGFLGLLPIESQL